MAIGRHLPAALLLTALLACLPTPAIAVEQGEQKPQAITFISTAPSNATIGGPTYTVKATGGASGNPVGFTIDAASKSVCTISGSTVSFTGAGTCTIDANQAGNSTYEAAPQKQQSFAVAKKPQTITFTSTAPSSATVAGPTYTVTATGGGSGNAVVFTIDAASKSVCSISGSTVSFTGAGTCTIDANQASSANYNAAPQAQQPVTVAKGSQAITFTSTPPSNATVGGPTYTVTATGGPSGNPVSFTIDAASKSVCTVAGSTVSFTGAGTCTIDANQEGNANYNAAPQKQQSFAVTKRSQTVAFKSTPPNPALVGAAYTAEATASSGLGVSFSSATSSVCTVSGATVSLKGEGTCTVEAKQEGNTEYGAAKTETQSFAVTKRTQTIAFKSTPPSPALVGATYTVEATASSGLGVGFSSATSSICSVSGATVSLKGEGTCKVEAKQEGNAEYSAAKTETQSFAVTKRSQTVGFKSTPPSPALVGATYTIEATASSGLGVSFSSGTPSVCSVSGSEVKFIAGGECVIDANQAGNAEYEPAPQAQQPVTVGKRSQTIAFKSTPPNPATVGGAPYNVSATASSGLAVSFSSATPSVCTISGSTVSFISAGTCTIDATQEGNTEYGAAKTETQSFAVKRSQTITFTSTPTNTVVGGSYTVEATASSGLAVSFASATPSVCTISGSTVNFIAVGTCTIDANQAGNAEYEAAPQVAQTFNVGKGSQSITFTSTPPGSATIGGPSYTVTATGGGSGNPIIFTIDAASKSVCTILGSTVSFIGAGTCTIDANQAGDQNYESAPLKAQSFAVHQRSQTIAFKSTPPSPAFVGAGYNVAATASSGLTVSFSSATPSVCTLSGSTVSFVSAGTCTIEANQEGNTEYGAAKTETQSFTVTRRSQTVAFTSSEPGNATVGGPTYNVEATASPSGLAVSFSSATPSVCTISGSIVTFIAAGTCTIDANEGGNAEYAPAPQAQQTFAVVAAQPPASPPSSPLPPIVQIKPPVIPNSSFRVTGATLSLATYAITFTESVADPGTFSWVLTFENGKFGLFGPKTKKCKAGSIRLKGKCRPARVLFGRGSQTVGSPGNVTFTVRTTGAGVTALRKAFKQNKGLPVTAYVTFQSARGGQPVSRVQSLIVKGRR